MRDIKEFDELYARLEDMKKRAVRGEIGISAFLSPRELHYAKAYLSRSGTAFLEYGGYRDAERKRLYVLPEYMEGIEEAGSLGEYGEETGICAVCAKGSGFCKLSHRDFMGSLLGLGVERSVIGDIIVTEELSATVFCDIKIADFLVNEWHEVGHDRIKCAILQVGEMALPERRYAQISDTVASARLDCVVAALCNLARERARACVVSELCEIDYEKETRPDKEVVPPALISVRGYGKFRVLSIEGQTKRGRYRISAQKFL
ncbi:MAG: hypothetical protein E7642_05930 [Ruminococcaceae bacterium]|nr:hypothetical protein [Oscillospiraceae bacterium]